jgi:hypothetical protein
MVIVLVGKADATSVQWFTLGIGHQEVAAIARDSDAPTQQVAAQEFHGFRRCGKQPPEILQAAQERLAMGPGLAKRMVDSARAIARRVCVFLHIKIARYVKKIQLALQGLRKM